MDEAEKEEMMLRNNKRVSPKVAKKLLELRTKEKYRSIICRNLLKTKDYP
jgi:hypothetical protein